MNILVLNAGSSSQKSCLYSWTGAPPAEPTVPLWEGTIDWTHPSGSVRLAVATADGRSLEKMLPGSDHHTIINELLATLWQGDCQVLASQAEVHCIGHRVVHGGRAYRQAVRISDRVKTTIRDLIPLAPAHNPVNLEGIEIAQALFGLAVPQVAVFDTAFHHSLPDAAATYPGPHAWLDQGIRRYGFHGISHEYCAQRAAQLLGRSTDLKLITCHLGNGCSLAAVENGRSIDTTMGFTPLDGLMMGSRSGAIDPGILLYLMRSQGLDTDQLDLLLNKQSGLKGLSGVSNDMRAVSKAAAAGDSQAQLAYDVYIHRLRSGIGAMLASLGGLDALVFTAGVGENNAGMRSQTCQAFSFLGLKLDESLNQNRPKDQDISTTDSRVRVLVIQTQENWQIARCCWTQLNPAEK